MSPLLEYILREYGSNPFEAFLFIFRYGGALLLIPVMVRLAVQGWIFWNQEHFKHHVPHTMFSIEVPQNNEQSMKAVEQIFVQIYGTYNIPDWWERWWLGFVQEEFALEIVSNGGYITYYVRTPTYYKEIVQAAFYSHYPDAILTETEDYTKDMNADVIMSGKVKVWGSEMRLESDDVKPIKTYPLFEHSLTQKAVDPMANVLEFMSRMQPGEKLWYQILVQPSDLPHLKHRAKEAIDAIVEPTGAGQVGPDIIDHIQNGFLGLLQLINKAIFGGEVSTEPVREDRLTERQRLTTPEREFVEEVDRKSSRWPYYSKVRFMYFAAPRIWDGKKARRGMLGGLRLYRFINAFTEGRLTRTDWGTLPWRFVAPQRRLLWRARKMFWAYRSRDMERGEHEGFVLSTEEITALFHFPSIDVRAPYVAKAQTRGVEPPTLLRYDDAEAAVQAASVQLEGGASDSEAGGLARSTVATENVIPEAAMQSTRPMDVPPPVQSAQPPVHLEPEPPPNLPFV